jgi:hypothetical protein
MGLTATLGAKKQRYGAGKGGGVRGFPEKPRNRSLKVMLPGRILDHIGVDRGLLKRRFISLRGADSRGTSSLRP